jgi:hypothetical protein
MQIGEGNPTSLTSLAPPTGKSRARCGGIARSNIATSRPALLLMRPVTIFVYELPRLQLRNDCHDDGGPLRRTGRLRCVRRLPGVLVRSFQKPAALRRLHTQAHEVYWGTLDTGETLAAGRAPLSAVRNATEARARLAGKHALHVLAMHDR